MAVDASHLNIFPPQLVPNRDFVYSNQGNVLGYNSNAQMGSVAAPPMMTGLPETLLPLNQSIVCDSLQPKTSINTDSGLTYNMPAQRKRSRESFDQLNTLKNAAKDAPQFPFFLGERLLPQIQQYQLDIDGIISHHSKKIRMELEERQKQQARLLVAAIGEGVMKKLKEKDEQIQRMGKLNLALQERVKSLYIENQLWRDLAQTNEATANSLRTNLEQILAHVSNERLPTGGVAAGGLEDDAESCCGSNLHLQGGMEGGEIREALGMGMREEEEGEASSCGQQRKLAVGVLAKGGMRKIATEAQDQNDNGNRRCRMCGERESCVLLLPCRHLCLCTVCGSTLHQTCPVCNNPMNATVHVNMSS